MQRCETIPNPSALLYTDLGLIRVTLHHISRDFHSIRYCTGRTRPHANTCRTGMNQQDPKSDICISTALPMTCYCEHQASISHLEINNDRASQPPTPLHKNIKAPPFPTLLASSSHNDPLQNQHRQHRQAGFPYVLSIGSKYTRFACTPLFLGRPT